jgi:DNA-directed RNA polymerase subunit M
MKFCDVCGNLLIVKNDKNKKFLYCRNCGKKFELQEGDTFLLTTKGNEKQKEVSVITHRESEFSITKVLCPKCQNMEDAEWTLIQTRAGDEPPTRFYRCLKCGHVWREYS